MQCGLAGTVAADAGHSDGVLGLLSSPFLGKRKLHLGRDCSNEGIQRPSILIVIGVAVLNYFSHVANLEPYLHHRGPLDVVGLGEGRPPTTGTDVLDNCMDLAVAMVLIRGGRAAPPVEATISVDPTAATESTAARSRPFGLPPRALSPGAPSARLRLFGLPPLVPPWGCTTAHCAVCSRAASLASLSSSLVLLSTEAELPVLLPHRASSSAAAARVASVASAASTFALAAASPAATIRDALAAVAAAARSRSYAAVTSASCWRRTLEVTELGLFFGHGVLAWGCCVGKRLSRTKGCSSEHERRVE
jgi:hypothetical protein